jgi:hypothetical protein
MNRTTVCARVMSKSLSAAGMELRKSGGKGGKHGRSFSPVDRCGNVVSSSLLEPSMTPLLSAEERARSIVDRIYSFETDDGKWAYKFVSDVVTQAVAEAVQQVNGIALHDKWHKAGYEDGLEMAAKIVQKWIDGNYVGPNPAKQIRALKSKGNQS